ncbi:hypothetical protein JOC85_003451 [Bacillus mesophilus]|uniref:FbpB family small basic protein n=1 Tax=Bacillus mesophilus TaxID=1808955 RepID=A0A6M0QAH0_9BACI|nr:FbpB family small basic protein [Bacillus mesophilus]MBM7662641.1 hypothetical protein [Bacillus mesophilus]NEY73293.1 FbpB family small basic protein [Bacillus mesophilus]
MNKRRLKKDRLSFKELIVKNKEEIMKSKEELDKIDKKIDEKVINIMLKGREECG